MHQRTRRLATLLGIAALAVPAAAAAKPAEHRAPVKRVKLGTFVFKGTYGAEGAVTVTGGNSRVRRNGFVGSTVTFDLAAAKVVVADVDGSGTADAADLQAGDRVVVQARLPRGLKAAGAGVLAARKVVDQTHPRASGDETDEAGTPSA